MSQEDAGSKGVITDVSFFSFPVMSEMQDFGCIRILISTVFCFSLLCFTGAFLHFRLVCRRRALLSHRCII